MPVVPSPKPLNERRAESPWDRQDIARLPQTNFRIVMRGFDRDEVRAILDSVAADYRVLQLQNRSLQRQLAALEGVLQAYQQERHPNGGANTVSAVSLEHDRLPPRAASEKARTLVLYSQDHDTMTGARSHDPAAEVVLIEAPVDAPVDAPAPPPTTVDFGPAVALNAEHSLTVHKGSSHTGDLALEVMLKNIDRALVAIPALPCE